MYKRTEQEITKNWKGNLDTPVVSICCTTYNHEAYIAEAIDGFLMQETDFPFEILIRDDCSTDNTAAIVKEYTDKYPTLIKPLYEKENTFSKGVRPMLQLYKISKGKYIALCEGDDYWTDTLKLQKQVTLLEKYPEAIMSVAYTTVYEKNHKSLKYIRIFDGNDKDLQEFNDLKKHYFHTSTYVIRADMLTTAINELSMSNVAPTDTALRFTLITYGPFVLLAEEVSVYRVNGHGIWTSLDENEKWQQHVTLHKGLLGMLEGRKYKQYQGELLYSLYRSKLHSFIDDGSILNGIQLLPSILFYGFFYRVPSRLFRWFQ